MNINDFLQTTTGNWISQRRYYYLKENKTSDVTTEIGILYLNWSDPELLRVAKLFNIPDLNFTCGNIISWKSYNNSKYLISEGAITMGVHGDRIFRDRGYMNDASVISNYKMNGDTLGLYTNYDGAQFSEEIKLLTNDYRTRQTSMVKRNELVMVGQYLETRN